MLRFVNVELELNKYCVNRHIFIIIARDSDSTIVCNYVLTQKMNWLLRKAVERQQGLR